MADKERNLSKIIAAILIAIMSAYSTYMSTNASSKSDDNQIASEALLNQMNTLIIPQIQSELRELSFSIKELSKDVSADRERLARIEGIIESLPARLIRHSVRTLENKPEAHSSLDKAMSKAQVVIPFLKREIPQQKITLKGE